MTSAEKMILKDTETKKAVVDVLKIFNGKSHKYASDVLKAAKFYLDKNSKFDVYSAIDNIENLAEKPVKKK